MPMSLKYSDFKIGSPEDRFNLVNEDIFYQDRKNGVRRPNTLPRPEGVSRWMRSTYNGEEMLTARVGDMLYMIADTDVFGYALFKFISVHDDNDTYKAIPSGSARPITNERNDIFMANNNSLQALAQTYNRRPTSNDAPVNEVSVVEPAMQVTRNEGVTGGIDLRILRGELCTRSYVAGYIMGNAPQVAMSLSRRTDKNGNTTVSIRAKESKPSRPLAVLVSFPARCVQRNGSLASPEDIAAGSVDYNSTPEGEMLHLYMSVSALKGYLAVMDKRRIPEYAPTTTSDHKEQWSAEEILHQTNGASFVKLHPTENKNQGVNSSERYRFSLKSTSPRRSLYAKGNIMCMRALEHVPVKSKTLKDEYTLNEMAFRSWEFRRRKDDPENALVKAFRECPTQLWATTYEIDGEVFNGIGSVFFPSEANKAKAQADFNKAKKDAEAKAAEAVASAQAELDAKLDKEGREATEEEKAEIQKLSLIDETTLNFNSEQSPLTSHIVNYIPWWQTGDQRDKAGVRLDRIVKRTYREATDTTKANMVPSAVLYKENPNSPLFDPYRKFRDFIVRTGYITEDQIVGLTSRASSSKKNSTALTPEQESCLDYFLQQEEIVDAIESVQRVAADRMVIKASLKAGKR